MKSNPPPSPKKPPPSGYHVCGFPPRKCTYTQILILEIGKSIHLSTSPGKVLCKLLFLRWGHFFGLSQCPMSVRPCHVCLLASFSNYLCFFVRAVRFPPTKPFPGPRTREAATLIINSLSISSFRCHSSQKRHTEREKPTRS